MSHRPPITFEAFDTPKPLSRSPVHHCRWKASCRLTLRERRCTCGCRGCRAATRRAEEGHDDIWRDVR